MLSKVNMHPKPSLASFLSAACETVPMFRWLMTVLSRKSISRFLFLCPSPSTIDGVMYLALCPQVMSQAPHHFRSSETQATHAGFSAQQSICLVISLDSDTSRAVHPQESLKVDDKRRYMPHTQTLGGKRREIVYFKHRVQVSEQGHCTLLESTVNTKRGAPK